MVQCVTIPETGSTVLFGRSAKDNDYLTFRLPGRDPKKDIWLHALNVSGAHVVLRLASQQHLHTDLVVAANIAAFYSQARGRKKVAVEYCQLCHVKKVQSSPLGEVEARKTRIIIGMPESAMNLHHDQFCASTGG